MDPSTCHFGPEFLPNGVRFNLWASPAEGKTIEIEIDGTPPVAMAGDEDGWFQFTSADAKDGSRYNFRIDGKFVPDPFSRFQPDGAHGASQVVDVKALPKDEGFLGRPLAEVIIYELHVGTFSREGTYKGVEERLDELQRLGITAIELMPIHTFAGAWNWGYDGTGLFAPVSIYGTPKDLKQLIKATHARGMMVYLDVVYNHFGPEGNYLPDCAPDFFNKNYETAWGAAVNLEDRKGKFVRACLLQHALECIELYGFDGLRFDAVHALKDNSEKHFLYELPEIIREIVRAKTPDRHIHLIVENSNNESRYLKRADGKPLFFDAQWSDDIHHALHVAFTGESHGYYANFIEKVLHHVARALTEGFAYQGEMMPGGTSDKDRRGEPSAHLPPEATVACTQNHDETGNRPYGERLSHLVDESKARQAMALLLLNPHIPLIFMGQEWNASTPFLYFCDWEEGSALARNVRKGRDYVPPDPASPTQSPMPDPVGRESFDKSRLKWDERQLPPHKEFLDLSRELIALRQEYIVPMIKNGFIKANYEVFGRAPGAEDALYLRWETAKNEVLEIAVNFSDVAVPMPVMTGERMVWDSDVDAPRGMLQPQQIIVRKGPSACIDVLSL